MSHSMTCTLDPCVPSILKHITWLCRLGGGPSGHRPRTAELDPAFLKAGKTDSCRSSWVFHVPTESLWQCGLCVAQASHATYTACRDPPLNRPPSFSGLLQTLRYAWIHLHFASHTIIIILSVIVVIIITVLTTGLSTGAKVILPWSKLSPSSTLLDKEDELRAAYRITELWQKAGSAQ